MLLALGDVVPGFSPSRARFGEGVPLAPSPGVFVAFLAFAYLLGSIPTGLWIARARGVDLRTIGSGNIGATNVSRGLGKGWAITVLILDAAKGWLPMVLGRRAGLSDAAIALVGLTAIVGHMFTFFLRGRGGKGVATSLGVSLAIYPPAGLSSFALYVFAYLVTRLSSVGSLLGMWSFPLFCWLFHVSQPFFLLSFVTAILVTVRHKTNIARLLRGEEKRA